MGRTVIITNERILESARAVFLRDGFSATAVEVAQHAGISSASIFKRYPTKEALFFASMAPSPNDRIWTPELEEAIGHGDPRADLLLIARRIASFTGGVLPRLMLLRSVSLQSGQNNLPMPPPLNHDFDALTSYFVKEMAFGRIAHGDPTIPALALLHTASGFAMSLTLQSAMAMFDSNSFLEDFVVMLWRGIEPRGGQ